jgi:flagellar biosynthetic protein FliQ
MPETLFHDGLMMLLVVGGPLLAALLVTGLIMGALQATTQINDPAVGFLPRMAVMLTICWLYGPNALERVAAFVRTALQQIAGN